MALLKELAGERLQRKPRPGEGTLPLPGSGRGAPHPDRFPRPRLRNRLCFQREDREWTWATSVGWLVEATGSLSRTVSSSQYLRSTVVGTQRHAWAAPWPLRPCFLLNSPGQGRGGGALGAVWGGTPRFLTLSKSAASQRADSEHRHSGKEQCNSRWSNSIWWQRGSSKENSQTAPCVSSFWKGKNLKIKKQVGWLVFFFLNLRGF